MTEKVYGLYAPYFTTSVDHKLHYHLGFSCELLSHTQNIYTFVIMFKSPDHHERASLSQTQNIFHAKRGSWLAVRPENYIGEEPWYVNHGYLGQVFELCFPCLNQRYVDPIYLVVQLGQLDDSEDK